MSENKPHLFISHATWRDNNNARTIKIREKLFELLNEKWDVFVDKERLNAGDLWRPIILHRLSKARAGIILFDETAVKKSDWVKAESLIMCFRKSLDPEFQLIPVLLDDLKSDNECFKSYQPFQLGEVGFKFDDCNKDTDKISEEIVCCLDIDKASVASYFNGWMYEFEGLLIHMDKTTLSTAWNSLIDQSDEFTISCDTNEIRRAVVELIHHSEPLKTIPAVEKLRREIRGDKVKKTKELIKAKWVDNKWVKDFFIRIRKRNDKLQLIYYTPEKTINSLELFELFFMRLKYERPNRYLGLDKITVSENAGDDDDAVLDHVKKTIAERLGSKLPYDSAESNDLIRKRLDEIKIPIICYIPKIFAKSNVLSQLHSQYPEIIFVVQVDSLEIQSQFKADEGVLLEPKLDDEKIKQFYELVRQLELIWD
jgi:TIR domain